MKTKDNKGITLIALIITIIIMLILASVTTYTGIDTYKNNKVNKFVIQMQLLQAKVDDLVATKTTEELNNIELQSITTEEQTNAITNAFKKEEITTADTSKYKVFTKEQVLTILDVEDVQNDILVNFETREIVDVVGIEYEGATYYTQYKLPGGQTIINNTYAVTRDLSFALTETIDGLNATITIGDITSTNGTLSYRETNSNYWTTITNYTKKGSSYEIVITKSTTYEFKLTDNVTGENSNETITDETTGEIKEVVPEINKKKVVVTNKPNTTEEMQAYNYALTSENWAYAKKGTADYVWIPRFAYDTNNNIKFIKGNSSIATDNTYLDNTWTVHEKFTTTEGIELTGIWVSVDSANQTGLNMITVLNDSNRTTLLEIYKKDYIEIEYIESTGTQYINTEYYPTINAKIEMDISFGGTFNLNNTIRSFFGARRGDYIFAANFGSLAAQANDIYYWTHIKNGVAGATIHSATYTSEVLNNRNTLVVTRTSANYGNYQITTQTGENTVDNPLILFGIARDTDVGIFSAYNMKLYSCKIYDGEIIIRDYIPVINKENDSIALYDKINDKYYYNQGTGDFVAGPDV